MKRTAVVVLAAMAAAALVGCNKQTGPKTTEIMATERPADELMPEVSAADVAARPVPPAPQPAPREPEVTTPPPTTPAQTYTVQRGDTLWSIAKSFYGDPRRWKVIAEANSIADETKIPVGQVLKIP